MKRPCYPDYIISLIIFTFILSLVFCVELNAQTYNGDLILTTQSDIDNFNYTSVTGLLKVEESTPHTITNLDGLSSLTSVGTYLQIVIDSSLTDISGLSNLTSVGHTITISDDPALTNLDGLSGITSVEEIDITGNEALTSIAGLSNLTTVSILLAIQNDRALPNLDGLSSLTSIGGISILGDYLLTNIDGLSNLQSASVSVGIEDNDHLTNIDGLSNLTSIGQSLSINGNEFLANLNGLSGCTYIGLDLSVFNNSSLTDFSGLTALAQNCGLQGSYFFQDNADDPPAELLQRFDACAADHPGIADAGPDQPVVVGNTVNLDGSGSSDQDGDVLTYTWSLISKPSGSTASLSDSTIVNPSFIADIAGSYIIRLVVYDGYFKSAPDSVTITALIVTDALQSLTSMINALPLNDGNKNSLNSKIANALKNYNKSKYQAVVNTLEDFIAQLNDLVSGGSLTAAQAQPLIDMANAIIDSIESLTKKSGERLTELPNTFALDQNYPNPFNPSTIIKYSVPQLAFVQLKVYDILGREVASLVNGNQQAGYYQVTFDGSHLASGLYIYRLTAGNFISTKKMLMIK
ncbi:MAG TPA: T9SS type A sorting domain-containing protein [Ignavibacteriaceae bacterium]|nr:T9SS type A sorting domain-containing protein [Ignavibacteriaceae bacterium]